MKKTIEFNLADLNEKSMLKMLKDNDADEEELFTLLEALFDMWSAALKFSAIVSTYAEERIPNFMQTFVKQAADHHGVSPTKLASLLAMLDRKHTSSTFLH